MGRLIGTVGYYDETTGRGFIHPDYDYQSHGLNLIVTPAGIAEGGPDSLRSGYRITCTVNNGQATDIKQYEGQGLNPI